MARLIAPLLSLGASGQIGNAVVFASWKGISYARRYVIPENPNTVAQQEVRGVFSTLSEMWKRMPALARRPFDLAIRGVALTSRNKHVQVNVAALQGDANMNDLVMSVSGGSAIPPASMTPSDGGGQSINVLLTAPTLPTGYTISSMVAVACLDGDPSPVYIVTTFAGYDETAPYSIDLAVGLAGTYQVGGFVMYIRTADTKIFTSAALRDQVVIA